MSTGAGNTGTATATKTETGTVTGTRTHTGVQQTIGTGETLAAHHCTLAPKAETAQRRALPCS